MGWHAPIAVRENQVARPRAGSESISRALPLVSSPSLLSLRPAGNNLSEEYSCGIKDRAAFAGASENVYYFGKST